MPLVDTIETFQMTNVGTHIDGTDVYQSNRNLLDNAYFVGGGSQLGNGILPINQRGQSSYGASMYGIDKWRTWGNMTVALTAAGLSLTSTEAAGLFQYPEQNRIMAMMGETVTFSVKVGGQVYSNTGTIYSGTWLVVQVPNGEAIFVVPQNYPSELISVSYRFSGAVSTPVVVQAMKLELGTVSTLDNDAPPNYWTELQKCKARLRFVPLTRCPIVFAAGNAYLDLNGCEMEGNPTAALYSNDGAVVGSSGASSAITSVTNIGINHNVPLLQFNLASAINDQVGQIYNTVVQLSSEL